MRRANRLLLALVGIGVFAVYALAAAGGYLLLGWLVADPPTLAASLLAVVLVTLVAAFLGYRLGTDRLLARLEATELPRNRAPAVHRTLDGLCRRMDVSRPALLVGDLGAPNALSIGGPRRSAVVVDRRLLGLLTLPELEGVIAHELAHVERHDTVVRTLAASLVQSAAGLALLVLSPLLLALEGVDRGAALIRGQPTGTRGQLTARLRTGVTLLVGAVLGVLTLLLFAHSRRREFAADRRAAAVTGDPVALGRALAKIHRATDPTWGLQSLLSIRGDERETSLCRLFSTHPPIEERIERLFDRS
jgi:heat shock protein HtpX